MSRAVPISQVVFVAFEGRVGRRFIRDDMVITTPNMDTIPASLFGTRQVRMLNDFHFGEDDPIYHPQPFDSRVPHLPFIRHPSNFEEQYRMLWFFPSNSPEHFHAENPSNPSLGRINRDFRDVLKGVFLQVKKRYSEALAAQRLAQKAVPSTPTDKALHEDVALVDYTSRLKGLFNRLELLTSYDNAIRTWCFAQRLLLEYEARVLWLLDIRKPFYSASMPRCPLLNVVGALTDSLEIADSLFRVGCPLWLARQLGAEQGVKVVKWLDNIPDNELPRRRMDVEVSYDHASPPHEVIYKGGAARLEKYRQMAFFIRKLLSPPSIFNAPVEAVASPVDRTEPRSSAAGPSRTNIRRGEQRTVPYPTPTQMTRPKGKNTRPPNGAASSDRNKFVDVVSDLMPGSLDAWATASKDIGPTVDVSKPARFGLMKGYAVPDPNMIAGFGHDPMAYAFTTYLKLRDVIIYRTTSGTFRPLATSSWRQMLGLELHGKKEGGHHGQKRSQLRDELTNCIKGAKLENSLDIANLQAASVTWRGQVLVPFDLPSVPICREILWELSEINFRVELVLLDSCCYECREEGFDVRDDREEGEVDYNDLDASNSADRQLKVLAAFDFPGGLVPLSAKEAGDGLASSNWRARRWALSALSRIMRGWRKAVPSMSTTLLGLAEKLNDPSDVTEDVVSNAESLLATYYVECFTSIFYRAPVLPHGL